MYPEKGYHNSLATEMISEKEIRPSPLGNMLQPTELMFHKTREHREVTYLRYECHQLSVVLSLFVRVDLENLPNAIIMIPLLKKFFLVCNRVSFDQIL